MMRTALFWYVLLVTVCVAVPCLTRLRPRTRFDWLMLRTTIAFLTWLLIGLVTLRAMAS